MYFLGVDAGGTNTFAVITNEAGEVAGIGKGGNGNYQINKNAAERNITSAINEALREANIQKAEIEYSWFGLAGADREYDLNILSPMIERLQFPKYEISCDTLTALRAGTSKTYGVVLICGTGVNSAGVNRAGMYYQCGGFGYLYGDFGGGSGLAIEVYRSVIHEWDGRGEKTLLTPLLLDKLGYSSAENMFHDYLDHNKRVPADVTKLLFIAAKQGDQAAKDILTYQGEEFGRSAKAVIERLQMGEETFDIVLSGSVLTRGRSIIIENEIRKKVSPIAKNSNIVYLKQEPVVGALLLAMDKTMYPITKNVYDNLDKITEIETNS